MTIPFSRRAPTALLLATQAVPEPESAPRRRPGPLTGFVAGLALAATGLALLGPGPFGAAHANLPPPGLPSTEQLDPLLRNAAAQASRAEAAAQRAVAATERVATLVAERGPPGERFLVAALLLRASIATPRPWLREYQAMAALAPPGALPPSLAEVLASHAARGLPSEAELRERFAALAPQLLARAPRPETMLDRASAMAAGLLANVGLAGPAPAGLLEGAMDGILEHLRRGNLAGAVADAGALDAAVQPLLAGWLAQARARLAVEQAVQETLLRALGPPRDAVAIGGPA
ncbi:hypothetical protein [Falsiroseomonas sp. E2-1-a20]|uniref:hypothetical protein n=1 Tax=Falsiroseomonas sp. E2-1-a20 TaxID=3239300 RepID=UPI003F3C6DA6